MYTLIVTFYVSLFGIISLLFLKQREIATGNKSITARIGAKADGFFGRIFTLIQNGYHYMNKKTLIALTQFLAFHVLLRIRKIYVELKHKALMNPHSKKVIDAVRGRGQIQSQGASFYLRRISTEGK